MTSVFLKILNMGIVAGWIALLVMLVRLPLKKAPRFITVLLWALVAVRLIFPFSPESPVSLVPDNEPIPANIFTPEIPEDPSPDAAVYPTERDGTTTGIPMIPGTTIIEYPGHLHEPQITVKRHVSPVVIAACVWAVGVAAMAVWAAVGCIRIKLRVREAIPQGGNVYMRPRGDAVHFRSVPPAHLSAVGHVRGRRRAHSDARADAHRAAGPHMEAAWFSAFVTILVQSHSVGSIYHALPRHRDRM